MLNRLNLRLVCDLRSAPERSSRPCLDWLEPEPRRLHLELSSGLAAATLPFLDRLRRAPDPEAARGLMETTYAHLPCSAAPLLSQLFESLVAGGWPLLVHCTAGKDRTGFTVAMILAALDVEPDFIRDDYLRGSGRDPLEIEQPSTHMMDALIGRRLTDEESRFVHTVHGCLSRRGVRTDRRTTGEPASPISSVRQVSTRVAARHCGNNSSSDSAAAGKRHATGLDLGRDPLDDAGCPDAAAALSRSV